MLTMDFFESTNEGYEGQNGKVQISVGQHIGKGK